MMQLQRQPRLTGAIAVLGLAFTLTACGGSDPTATDGSDDGSTASAAPSEAGNGGLPGGGDPSQLAAIQECLTAAGLADALPTGNPSGGPTGSPPTGMPSGSPPSGMPSGSPPTGNPSGGPGGGGPGGAFQDPDVQAALKACGLDLPSGPPSDQPSDFGSTAS